MSQRSGTPSSQSLSQGKRPRSSMGTQREEEEPTFTQPSRSQVQKGLEKLTPAQLDQKTAEVVQYFLVKDQKKIPIRRADLVKQVVKEYKNVYPEIIKRAAQTFEQVFGLKVVEIDAKNHVYILVNKLETVAPPQPIAAANPKMGLLFVILGVIYMKGGVVRESLIWTMLKKLRVDPGEKHPEFGDVRKLIVEEFVRQRYLDYIRIPHTEPLEYEFGWGQRAQVEVSKAKILDFMGELHEREPQSWTQQYREAYPQSQSSQSQSSQSQPGTSSQR